MLEEEVTLLPVQAILGLVLLAEQTLKSLVLHFDCGETGGLGLLSSAA